MGGRLVTELAATQPDRVIGLILLDAIVGDTWDRMVYLLPVLPALDARHAGTLVADTITTVPWFGDPRQALKLGRLVRRPPITGHLRPSLSACRGSPNHGTVVIVSATSVPAVPSIKGGKNR